MQQAATVSLRMLATRDRNVIAVDFHCDGDDLVMLCARGERAAQLSALVHGVDTGALFDELSPAAAGAADTIEKSDRDVLERAQARESRTRRPIPLRDGATLAVCLAEETRPETMEAIVAVGNAASRLLADEKHRLNRS